MALSRNLLIKNQAITQSSNQPIKFAISKFAQGQAKEGNPKQT